MGVFETIKKRKSIRGYSSDPVPQEILERILEAGRLAPSAYNAQDWKFIVVRDQDKREKLVEVARGKEFLAQAPVVIAAVALEPEKVLPCGVPNYALDIAIAVDHMILAATEEGLATCWIGAFSQDKAKEVLGIPNNYKAVVLFPLGYGTDKGREKERKKLEEIVCQEKFKL